jgi:hypothetical protein
MICRYMIESFSRNAEEATDERLREIGLEAWQLVSVLPGTRENPSDPDHFTCFFTRDATDDISL